MLLVAIVIVIVLFIIFLKFQSGTRHTRHSNADRNDRISRRTPLDAPGNITSRSLLGDWRKCKIVVSYELIDKIGLLAEASDLYVVSIVKQNQIEDERRNNWDLLAPSMGLNGDKILFCETQTGLVAMIRQLEPHLVFLSMQEYEAVEILRKLPRIALQATIGLVKNKNQFETIFEKCTGSKLD